MSRTCTRGILSKWRECHSLARLLPPSPSSCRVMSTIGRVPGGRASQASNAHSSDDAPADEQRSSHPCIAKPRCESRTGRDKTSTHFVEALTSARSRTQLTSSTTR
eukprot:6192031-Pleurochrysis_carterae.AAC.2